MLVHALDDPDPAVRGEAADALGAIGDPSTGYDLFKRLTVEDDPGVRFWLLMGLGSTRYAPAVPVLIEALADEPPGTGVRDFFAVPLAALGDKSALPAQRQADAEEPEREYSYYSPKGEMRRAIEALEGG